MCDICGTSLKTRHSLARHKRTMHPSGIDDVTHDVTRAAKKPWSEARREFHQKNLRNQRSSEVSLKISKSVAAAHAKAKLKGKSGGHGSLTVAQFQDANAEVFSAVS